MLRGTGTIVCLFGVLLVMVASASAQTPIDNRAVKSGRNDVVCLAHTYGPSEALPLGNGQLGVMVGNRPGMNYLFYPGSFFASADQNQLLIASGELSIHLPEQWMKGLVQEQLALLDGTIVTQFKTAGVRTITSSMPRKWTFLVVEIESSSPLPDFKAELTTPTRPNELNPQITAANGLAALTTVGLCKTTCHFTPAPSIGWDCRCQIGWQTRRNRAGCRREEEPDAVGGQSRGAPPRSTKDGAKRHGA